MTIGFDARFISVPGGIPRYCRELLHHLAEQNPQTRYVALVKKIPDDFQKFQNLSWAVVDIPWYGFSEQLKLGRAMNAHHEVDLWHIPHWNVPLTVRRPFVMTIHDFIFEEFPTHNGSLGGRARFFLKWVVWRALLTYNVRRARAIITVSKHIQKKIEERFPWARHKIFVTYEAPACTTHGAPKNTPPHTAPRNTFFLAVGNSYPHKNYELILAAYEKDLSLTTPTIIVTHRDRFSEALQRAVVTRGLTHKIIFVFDATDALLAELTVHAAALVFPSREEGFGIPPLEAYAVGTHVIALHLPVLHELLGDVVWWIENDPAALAAALHATREQHKTELPEAREARKNIAARFHWRETAFSTQKIYRSVLY